jgi:hypothetical protein
MTTYISSIAPTQMPRRAAKWTRMTKRVDMGKRKRLHADQPDTHELTVVERKKKM